MRVNGETADLAPLLAGLNSAAQEALTDVMDSGFDGRISAEEVQGFMRATGMKLPDLMLFLSGFAALYAYVPISGFPVGAVALGASGALYYGANLEFAGQALGFCIHAEQSATTNARSHGEIGLQALAINAAPCGYCRQFLNELRIGASLNVYVQNGPTTLGALLPDPFGPAELKNRCRLMDPMDHKLSLAGHSADPVLAAALNAANNAYAPYTEDFAGVALQIAGGAIYSGGSEENVAYNPSVSPMEAALVSLNMSGSLLTSITRAILVESRPSECSQRDAARAVLKSLNRNLKLEPYHASSAAIPDCIQPS